MATAVAAGVIGSGPVVGDLRGALLSAWPQAYVPVLVAIVVLGALLIVGAALYRLRREPWTRTGLVLAALLVAVGCGALVRTGDANVDAVEAFHFVEYGALALAIAWAAAPACGGAAVAWAWLIGVGVGTADEWLQWFVPGRTGEVRDVGLNAVAVACGAAVAVATGIGSGRLARGQLARLGWGAAALVVAVTSFVATVHLGHEVADAAGWRFLSRGSARQLEDLARDRASRWGTARPADPGRYGREDQYLSEALWHVRRRNDALEDEAVLVAAREEAILERYFAPVLRVSGPRGPFAHALPPDRLLDLRRRAAPAGASDANPLPIFTWSPWWMWSVSVALSAGCIALGQWGDGRLTGRPT